MTDKEQQTDEDKMIKIYEDHRDLITRVIKQLKEENIDCERTTGNNRSGDILYCNEEDAEKVKEIVRRLHREFNQE